MESPPPRGADEYRALAERLRLSRNHDNKLDAIAAEAQEIEGTVTQLQILIAFDDKLEEMASIASDHDGARHVERLKKSGRRKFYLIRACLNLTYFVIIPFIQAPDWCLNNL